MSDEQEVPEGTEPNSEEAEIIAEAKAEAIEAKVTRADTEDAPLSALIKAKRELRAANKRVKELEPVAAKAQEVASNLAAAQPYINAILNNKQLKAQVLREVDGTRQTAEEHAPGQIDPEMAALAEDFGMYLADGQTPDVARVARTMKRVEVRNQRLIAEQIRPFAGLAVNQKAEANIREALQRTDNDGVPLASEESIMEVARGLTPELLTNPDVVRIVLMSAIGKDKMEGRTPKAHEEPLYLNSAGGRGRQAPVLDQDMRDFMARQGIKEADGLASIKRFDEGVASRKGIALGGTK